MTGPPLANSSGNILIWALTKNRENFPFRRVPPEGKGTASGSHCPYFYDSVIFTASFTDAKAAFAAAILAAGTL